MQVLFRVARRQIRTCPAAGRKYYPQNIIYDKKESAMRTKTKRTANAGRRPAKTNSTGNARKSHERYMTLARDAEAMGDAAGIENLYQHAEHYFRLMREQAV